MLFSYRSSDTDDGYINKESILGSGTNISNRILLDFVSLNCLNIDLLQANVNC